MDSIECMLIIFAKSPTAWPSPPALPAKFEFIRRFAQCINTYNEEAQEIVIAEHERNKFRYVLPAKKKKKKGKTKKLTPYTLCCGIRNWESTVWRYIAQAPMDVDFKDLRRQIIRSLVDPAPDSMFCRFLTGIEDCHPQPVNISGKKIKNIFFPKLGKYATMTIKCNQRLTGQKRWVSNTRRKEIPLLVKELREFWRKNQENGQNSKRKIKKDSANKKKFRRQQLSQNAKYVLHKNRNRNRNSKTAATLQQRQNSAPPNSNNRSSRGQQNNHSNDHDKNTPPNTNRRVSKNTPSRGQQNNHSNDHDKNTPPNTNRRVSKNTPSNTNTNNNKHKKRRKNSTDIHDKANKTKKQRHSRYAKDLVFGRGQNADNNNNSCLKKRGRKRNFSESSVAAVDDGSLFL